jgi:hypothetical protein
LRDEFAMADEAFALSPISARAELPSAADYDAIREAFMETARGRWFLGEYGKRNRNTDTSMVLDAVARIEATIAAQRQAPANELPDALVMIRRLLSDAKASAANTMSGPDAEQALAAVNRGTRIIREIAWTLREYGTDIRICDMLDSQVDAIDGNHQQTIAPEKRDALLAIFDFLIRRIGELGGSGGASPSSDSETSSSPSSGYDDRAPAATAEPDQAPPPFETASQALEEAVVDVAAAEPAELTEAPPPFEPAWQALEQAVVNAATDATAEPAEAPAPFETASEAVAQAAVDIFAAETRGEIGTTTLDEPAPDTPQAAAPLPETSAAVMSTSAMEVASTSPVGVTSTSTGEVTSTSPGEVTSTSAGEVTSTSAGEAPGVPAEEVIAAADVDAEDLAFQAAQDLAVLDVIALEMAEPEIAGSERAEPPQEVEPDIVEAVTLESGSAESGSASAEASTVETGSVEIDPVEARSVALASETSIAPEQEPEMQPQLSLGATLIASGIVPGPRSTHDALAPIRRMTQAERIAFFS